jgi:hypothetical protein
VGVVPGGEVGGVTNEKGVPVGIGVLDGRRVLVGSGVSVDTGVNVDGNMDVSVGEGDGGKVGMNIGRNCAIGFNCGFVNRVINTHPTIRKPTSTRMVRILKSADAPP